MARLRNPTAEYPVPASMLDFIGIDRPSAGRGRTAGDCRALAGSHPDFTVEDPASGTVISHRDTGLRQFRRKEPGLRVQRDRHPPVLHKIIQMAPDALPGELGKNSREPGS